MNETKIRCRKSFKKFKSKKFQLLSNKKSKERMKIKVWMYQQEKNRMKNLEKIKVEIEAEAVEEDQKERKLKNLNRQKKRFYQENHPKIDKKNKKDLLERKPKLQDKVCLFQSLEEMTTK